MKKIVIVLAIMSFWTNSVQAQKNEEPGLHKVELGVRLMPTFSAFKMTNSSGGEVATQVTLGYGIGGMIGYNITKNVGIQAEIIYNSLSQKFKDESYNRQINVKYVNIPLMISLNTNKAKAINFNMVLGPQLGLNLGSSVTTSGGSSDTLTTVWQAKQSDFGFAYGAGLEFMVNPAHTLRLGIGYRGVYGFVNISEAAQSTSNTYTIQKANVKTNSAYLGIAFLF